MNKTAILGWFTGKALEGAKAALEMLEASLAQGSWVKGASRKVPAALNKPTVAQKLARAHEKELERIGVPDDASEYDQRYRDVAHHGWSVAHCMTFGSFTNIQSVDFEALRKNAKPALLPVVAKAEQYARDFAPVAAAIKKLDATKPVPVFTTMNASPTVSAELQRQGAEKVEVCPMKFEEHSRLNPKTGKIEYFSVVLLLWPEGTQHGTSRYANGTAHNDQCHACGHAIRNAFNWVPLVLTTKDGAKKSLWVGRDCAETLFGVKMDGDLELAPGQR